MTHRSNAVADVLPFRICGAMATHLRKSKKEKALGCRTAHEAGHYPAVSVRFLGARIYVTAPPQTEPTISPRPKELATTSRGCGSNVKSVGGVYCTDRVAPSLSITPRHMSFVSLRSRQHRATAD
jgi:hypothetical protein